MEVNRIRSRFDSQPILGEGEVLAAFHDGTFTAWAITFTPEEIEIPVGGTVKWRVMGDHTITFNAPESARPFYERAEDGSIRENELAAEQQGDASGWDGSGIFNSGLRSGVPDRLEVTFTRPGTYAYLCTIHFGMEGRVKVIE